MTDEPLARLYCPRCRATLTAIGATEPPPVGVPCYDVGIAVSESDDDTLTSCPKCGHELQVLSLSDEMRAVLRENRDDDRWRGLP